MEFKEFVKKIKHSYRSDQIEIRSEPPFKPNSEYIFLNIFRMYRALIFLENYIKTEKTDKITLCDAGAYPFTFLKVAKLFYPNIRLYSVGIHEEDLVPDNIKRSVDLLNVNLDPWVCMPPNKETYPTEIPLLDNGCDLIIFMEVIEHLYNPVFVLKEFYRILKPGGQLYLTTNNISYLPGIFRVLRGGTNLDNNLDQTSVDFKNMYPGDWRGHVRFYSLNQLADILTKRINFKLVKKTYFENFSIDSKLGERKYIDMARRYFINSSFFPKCYRSHLEIVVEK